MRLLFFAHLRDITHCAEMNLDCESTDTDGLWDALLGTHPGLAPCRQSVRLASNGRFAGPGERFTQADEVALIPPVSGG